MHAIAWRTFRASQGVPARQACRIIAGVRRPLPSVRKFHRSAISYQAPEEPTPGAGSPVDPPGKGIENDSTSEAAEHPGTEAEPETVVTNGEDPQRTRWKKIRTDYGSAANRSNRSKKSTGVPPVVLPSWLSTRITLAEERGDRVGDLYVSLNREIAMRCKPWPQDLPPEELAAIKKRFQQIWAESEKLWKGIERDLPPEELSALKMRFQESWAEEERVWESLERQIAKAKAIKDTDAERYGAEMKSIGWRLSTKMQEVNEALHAAVDAAIMKDNAEPAAVMKEPLDMKPEEESAKGGEEVVNQNPGEAEIVQSELEELEELEDAKLAASLDDHPLAKTSPRYSLPGDQYSEIVVTLRAALALEAPKDIDLKDISKPTTLLLCPKDGGILFLDAIVEEAAGHLHADLLRLDSEDLAEIVGSYIGENVAWTSKKNTALLGYDSQEYAGRMETIQPEVEDAEKFSEDEEDLDKPRPRPPRSKIFPMKGAINGPQRFRSPFSNDLKNMLSILNPKAISSASIHISESPVPGQSPFQMSPQQASAAGMRTAPGSEAWIDLKINTAIEALLDAVKNKRKEWLKSLGESHNGSESSSTPKGLIVQIRDYRELVSIPAGLALISKFEDFIKKRWQAGEKITLVGTTSAQNQIPDFTKADIEALQSSAVDGTHRTIVVVPDQRTQNENLDADERTHMRLTNIRHVESMVLKLSGKPGEAISLSDMPDLSEEVKSELEDSVWPLNKVYRVATLIVGQLNPAFSSDMKREFVQAIKLIRSTDEIRFTWAKDERKQLEESESNENGQKDSTVKGVLTQKAAKERIKQLKDKCNFHEKKLLSGVVLPDDIKTTFSDVRAPPETIEALKTLTSLSLIRPEAFSYGVLATDKIPGLLLYGPPGTGKTMLAKAVAKQSGATVLDVSGADLFNLYVGEGEKNVKALFSLAKKLSPCVVFIDEADAIFGSRGGNSSKRTSHRELINQFLREWDGMNDMSAFIMVATNRPFDLDDAVLRRLPRRLLVDLPTEKDREAILKIHLSNEVLDDSVSLSTLAKETPFYSGSDLKNVSVAAALACVREEFAEAAKHTGDEPYVYPPKRTLSKRHFDKALEEISASISEDMSTLTAVRKFDEKYGDRKGRRKKRAALGFGGLPETDKDSEAGRVRKVKPLVE